MTIDEKNLDLLSIFHYIVGGITALLSCIPIIHIVIGVAMLTGKLDGNQPPPPFFGWLFVLLGSFFIFCGMALSLTMIVAGRKIKARKSRTFCVVLAGIECIVMPFGTVLGILTIITLMKESVVELFAANHGLHPIGAEKRANG
jgi:hypothetical protein